FVVKVTGTVSGGVGTYASFTLPKTDAATPTYSRYNARIYTSTGSPTDYYPFQNFHLRQSLGDSINFQAWWNDNQVAITPQPDGAPSISQMNIAIAAANNAPATTTQNGIVEISTNPTDSAHPIAVETNDRRVGDFYNI